MRPSTHRNWPFCGLFVAIRRLRLCSNRPITAVSAPDSTDGTFGTATQISVSGNTTTNLALVPPTIYTLSGTFTAGGVPQGGGYVYVFNAAGSSLR